MTAVFAILRAVHFASLMTVFGAEAFAFLLRRAGLSKSALSNKTILVAASIALVTAVLSIAATAAVMSGDAASAFDPETLRLVAFETLFGRLALARIVLLALLVVLLAMLPRMTAAGAFLSGAALALMGWSSHAAATSFSLLGSVNDALHLLAAGFWFGGLAVLVTLALARTAAAEFMPVLRKFSAWGMLAVALLIVAGAVNGILILGGAGTHWANGYIGLLALKLVLAALMVALALTNRYGLMSGLARGEAEARQTLSTTMIAELALGAAVLLVAGFLGMSAPLQM